MPSVKTALSRGAYWNLFPDSYRKNEIKSIADWLKFGYSGSVIGGSGSGKSNLFGFISSKPHLLTQYMAPDAEVDNYLFCSFDVNSLPNVTPEYFYGEMVRVLKNKVEQTIPELAGEMETLASTVGPQNDVLTLSRMLDQLHTLVISQTGRTVVWLIDRFDEACRKLDVGSLNNLRWLRDQARYAAADQFRAKFAYVIFSRRPMERLRERKEISEFIEIIEDHTTWVGPMSAEDTLWNIDQIAQRAGAIIEPDAATMIAKLSGGLTSFTKLITESYCSDKLDLSMTEAQWIKTVLSLPAAQRICQEILDELALDEHTLLATITSGATKQDADAPTVTYLRNHGYATQNEQGDHKIFSPILYQYIDQTRASAISNTFDVEPNSGTIRLNGLSVAQHFTALEAKLFRYLLEYEGLLCTRDALEDELWPDDFDDETNMGDRRQGLATLIKQLRQKIRELTASEYEYIVTVRGQGFRYEVPHS